MNLSYRIFAINPYTPDQFETFYVVASQLEEAENHVESLGVKSFITEELTSVSGTHLIALILVGRPPIRSTTKSVILMIGGHGFSCITMKSDVVQTLFESRESRNPAF